MVPLAETLRPKTIDDFVGQEHLVGINGPIRKAIESGTLSSMIFWGPPGTGKTTLARLIPEYSNSFFVPYSAIGGSIREVRQIVATAKDNKLAFGKDTILFVDEIHRFNKAQQDAFLPHIENGSIILIGATTENPGFEVNAPLISRSQIYIFNKLSSKEIKQIIELALKEFHDFTFEKKIIDFIIQLSNGDARKAINALELLTKGNKNITLDTAKQILQTKFIDYDKKGDSHYDTISAFIKSMRGGDPNATVHYLARMIHAGEDPMFIARRMVIFASEDIGNAKPNALVLATSAMQAVNMVGMPEAKIILSQCATYLATCPKSIASYVAINEALADIKGQTIDPIPLHLRNAANKVMKEHNYGKGYKRYPWLLRKTGEEIIQEYLPRNLINKQYYRFGELSE